jgi:5,10-methenyltetrahydromethanopterin hydrogenase
MVRIAVGLVVGVLAATSVQAQQAQATPPAQQAAAAPAKRVFSGDSGLVLNFIKADKTADFEAVMAKLKEALNKSDKPERKAQAAGWKILKAAEPGAGGSVLYVFIIDPAVKDADYTVSTILAEGFPQEVNTIFKQYADSFASGQNFVNLTTTLKLGQ